MKAHMIQGTKITLTPALPSDRQTVYEWCFHSETTKCHAGPPDYPEAPIASAEEFFRENGGYEDYFFTGERPRDGRGFLIMHGGKAVGFVSYASFHLKPGVTECDIWMNSEAHCGKGFGTDALVALTEYLNREQGVHTLIMRPCARNARAVRAYNKAGFVPSAKPIDAYMLTEYLSLFGDGDYGPGGDALLVKPMITYRDTHAFTPQALQDLFLSVEWSSGHYPEKLAAAMQNFGTVYSAWETDAAGNECLVGLISAMDDGVMTAYVHYLLVHPAYQRRGIGKRLVELIREHYREYLRIVVVAYNAEVDFYASCGFKKADGASAMFITSLWT